eukprot:355821-Chlamydomonas_euryale.AAC.4
MRRNLPKTDSSSTALPPAEHWSSSSGTASHLTLPRTDTSGTAPVAATLVAPAPPKSPLWTRSLLVVVRANGAPASRCGDGEPVCTCRPKGALRSSPQSKAGVKRMMRSALGSESVASEIISGAM